MDELIEELERQVYSAMTKHGPLHSHHEAYGVIMEEVCEYFDQVRLWPGRVKPTSRGLREEEGERRESRHTSDRRRV